MRRKPFRLPRASAAVLAWVLAWVLALALGCQCRAAEVLVSGTYDRIVVRANDATLADILDALRSALHRDIEFRGMSTQTLSGVYSGSVRHVLSRLLKDQDYVMRSDTDRITIRLLGASAADASAAPSSAAPWQGSRLTALRQGRLRRTEENH